MGLRFERNYPVLSGTVAWLLCSAFMFKTRWLPPDTIRDLFNSVVNVAAIMAGFLSAALAILFTVKDSAAMRHLCDVDYLRHVVDYMIGGIFWAILLASVSGLSMLIGTSATARPYYLIVVPLWVGVLMVAAVSYFRVVRIFATILKSKATI